MRIGVDATVWQNNRGYGRHARALLTALVQNDTGYQYTFFSDNPLDRNAYPSSVESIFVPAESPTALAASANGRRSLADMWQMSRTISRVNLDVLLFPTVYSYIPVVTQTKIVVMIHDIIPERFPQHTLPDPISRLFWNIKSKLSRWQADAIVTVSEYSRQGIIQQFNLNPDRVFVVGEASDPVFRVLDEPVLPTILTSKELTTNHRMVVYVGGFGPHKNLDALIRVMAKITASADFEDVRLILVGEYKKEVFYSEYTALLSLIDQLKIQDRVIFSGYLTDHELVDLLNLASVLILPSLMEGFGLPAIEAAACGCPVVATRESPLPSILGEGGLYIDPNQPAQIEDALKLVLNSSSLRNYMGLIGRQAAAALTWQAAAQQMLTVFERFRN